MAKITKKKKTVKNYFFLGIKFLKKDKDTLHLKFVNPFTL
jgi:hypothetical protein